MSEAAGYQNLEAQSYGERIRKGSGPCSHCVEEQPVGSCTNLFELILRLDLIIVMFIFCYYTSTTFCFHLKEII